MKLEVGQKIGIYEIVSTPYNEFKLNQQITCIDYGNIPYPLTALINDYSFVFSRNEVRKVGSLIVKRLK